MKLFIKNLSNMLFVIICLYTTSHLLNSYIFNVEKIMDSSTFGVYAFIMYFMGEKK